MVRKNRGRSFRGKRTVGGVFMTFRNTDRKTACLSGSFVCLFLLASLCSGHAMAQGNLMDRVGSVFDGVARGLDFVGKKAQDLLGPGLGFGHGEEGGFVELREFEERYPVTGGAHVSVSNAFGGIRVATWDNQVVQIAARMSVRAETIALARELAQGISIHVASSANRIEAETVFPDPRSDMGKLTYEVNYEILVPKDAGVTAHNDFGDIHIAGAGGAVVVDVRYGAVELNDIAGRADVRARGEFPVEARNLRQGGVFDMHGARAVFRNVAGPLKAANFRGSIELYEAPDGAEADIACESGSVTFWISKDGPPPFSATALFGDVYSDIPVARVAQQGFVSARSNDTEKPVRITLRTSFGDIAIKNMELPPGAASDAASATAAGQPFKEVLTLAETLPDNGKVIVEGMAGDVRIIGADAAGLRATAAKYVRVQSQPNVRAALQALDVRATRGEDGAISIRTVATDNMAALGCTIYRVDLTIECPRDASVQIQAQDGHTSIEGIGGAVSVVQHAGAVVVEHVKGALSLTNRKGDIRALSCAGPIEASASYGEIALKEVYGKMTVEASQARTSIESPHGEIVVRAKGGDVRVLSLDAVPGNFDIRAEQGARHRARFIAALRDREPADRLPAHRLQPRGNRTHRGQILLNRHDEFEFVPHPVPIR